MEARQGHLLELRGDEALVVFNSARQALRAAVDPQARFALAGLPRGVGIGLDSGEAIPVGSGYRGAALNLAARLCAQAGPGQILASETVIRLAARVAGVAYVDPQTLRLKGFDEPVRAFEVVPEERVRRGGAAGFVRRARRLASRPAGLTATAAFVAVAVLLVVLLPRAFGGKPPVSSPAPSAAPVRGNKLVRIDAATSRVVAEIPVGTSPTGVTTGAGSVWVADSAGTVSRIDPVTNKVIVAIPVGKEPEAIGFDGTHIWVADRIGTAMYELDPGSNRVVAKVALDTRPVSVAFAGSRVFVAGSSPSGTGEAPVIGIDEATHETTEIARLATLAGDATGCLLVAGMEGAVWATNREGRVVKLEPTTGREIGTVQLDDLSHAIVAGPEGLWVLASGFPGRVRLLDSSSLRTIATIPVGSTAVGFSSGQCIRARPAMAEADRLLWVTNLSDGTLSKVDVSALRGVGTVAIGRTPTGVAADFGSVWVTVCSQATCETSIGG